MKNVIRKDIKDLLEKEVIILDKGTSKEIDISNLLDLVESKISKREFLDSIDLNYFEKAIDEFMLDNSGQELSFEFYAQHKRELEEDKNKEIIFQKKFNIIDLPDFKEEFKKKNWYQPSFYEKKLRTEILERQNFSCGMCGADVKSGSPHLHHINYKKSDCSKVNLIFICPRCHGKTNSNREFWEKLLTEKQEEYIK